MSTEDLGILKVDFLPGEDIELLPHVVYSFPLLSFMLHGMINQKEDKTVSRDNIQKRYLMKIEYFLNPNPPFLGFLSSFTDIDTHIPCFPHGTVLWDCITKSLVFDKEESTKTNIYELSARLSPRIQRNCKCSPFPGSPHPPPWPSRYSAISA